MIASLIRASIANRFLVLIGAAFMAGLGTGVWGSLDELAATWALDRRFEPEEGRRDDGRHERWRSALPRAGSWTT